MVQILMNVMIIHVLHILTARIFLVLISVSVQVPLVIESWWEVPLLPLSNIVYSTLLMIIHVLHIVQHCLLVMESWWEVDTYTGAYSTLLPLSNTIKIVLIGSTNIYSIRLIRREVVSARSEGGSVGGGSFAEVFSVEQPPSTRVLEW